MIRIGARDLENAFVEHHDAEGAERHTGSDQDLVHVVDAEASCLFYPVFDEGIAQSVFGLRFGKIRAFDNETIFAHFYGRLSRSFLSKSRRQVSGRGNFTTAQQK